MSDDSQKALFRALYKLLRPMVRLLMRQGITYRLFVDVARHVYIDVANEDFALAGRKQSNSRVAVLTGINRKDIAKLKERPHPLEDGVIDNQNSCGKVITAWINNSRYLDSQGSPLELLIEPDSSSNVSTFTQLVQEYSTDVPVRAVLDELVRIGAVSKQDNRVKLLTSSYIPQENMAENLRIFGTATADLIGTMDHNIAKLGVPLIQRTVSYDNIPQELLDRIRKRSKAEGETFLLQVNDWLKNCDRGENTQLIGSGKTRAGIGIYYFEQPASEDSLEDKK